MQWGHAGVRPIGSCTDTWSPPFPIHPSAGKVNSPNFALRRSKKFALRNSYLANNLACLGVEKNGHVTYRLDASKS